jgi:phosphoribosylglycinamide formyltransferase-1
MKRIAIFISGAGSLLESFISNPNLEIVTVIASRECAGVERAKSLGINRVQIRSEFGANFALELNKLGIEVAVLAGFLKVIPAEFLETFEGKTVNIHPSLLPKYGGIGFYGQKVLQAALDSGDAETGITIHYVTAEVDHGPALAQFKVKIDQGETLESLNAKISSLEKENYNKVVEGL